MPLQQFYIEFHDADSLRNFGYRQSISTNVIILGRDFAADVRFLDEFPMVSRRHAIIRHEEGQYIIEPLSQTSVVLVNDQRIFRPTILRNGDEIRLAANGPRLGIFFQESRRLGSVNSGTNGNSPEFQNNGNKPHRKFLWNFLILLAVLFIFGIGGWMIYDLIDTNRRLDELVTQNIEQQNQIADSINKANAEQATAETETPTSSVAVQTTKLPTDSAMKIADKSVYYVMALGFDVTTPYGEHYEIKCGNGRGEIPGWSGTGFLLSDGRFVTARHVVEPWFFLESGDGANSELVTLNTLASNGGKVEAIIGAVSASGDKIRFRSSDCFADRSGDQWKRTRSGRRIAVAPMGSRDFATVQTTRTGGGLPFSQDASRNLSRGTKLTVLSFPLGLGANSDNDINPVYGAATVAADGLQDGMILTTETAYEKGSSGGPVFITDENGKLIVVGITSAIAGRSTGFVEPISSIR